MSRCDLCEDNPVAPALPSLFSANLFSSTGWLHSSPPLGSLRLCAGCALSNPDVVCPCCHWDMELLQWEYRVDTNVYTAAFMEGLLKGG